METMSSYSQTIETLRVQARDLVTALKSMAEVFEVLTTPDALWGLRWLRGRVADNPGMWPEPFGPVIHDWAGIEDV